MTLSRAARDAKRRPRPEPKTTILGAFAEAFLEVAESGSRIKWPSTRYENDPEGFAYFILGRRLWSKQVEIAKSVVENRKTSVRSGHRVGKTELCAILALWFYCSFPKARVFLTGPSNDVVDQGVWRAIKMLIADAGCCVDCRRAAQRVSSEAPDYPRPCPHSAFIDGKLHESSDSGLVSEDFREILGISVVKPEAMQGKASPHLLFVVDEATGVSDPILRVVHSNLAAKHSRLVMIANPTKSEGIFYDSHNRLEGQYKTFQISSLDAASVVASDPEFDGLASYEWCKETAKLAGGVDTAEYMIRVLGQFPPEEAAKVIGRALIDEAIIRWGALPRANGPDGTEVIATSPNDGLLHIGVDVARFGDDDTAIAVRRGMVILEIWRRGKTSDEDIAFEVFRLRRKWQHADHESCKIKVDASGIGQTTGILLARQAGRLDQVIPVNSSERAHNQNLYAYRRDELWFLCQEWLRAGGAIPPDERLSSELHQPSYSYNKRGQKTVTSKDQTRKELGRSPDAADAVALACYELDPLWSSAPRASLWTPPPATPGHPSPSPGGHSWGRQGFSGGDWRRR